MPQFRVNADGSVTYWPDGWDEPAVPGGVVTVKDAPVVESKVVEAPASPEPQGTEGAETKAPDLIAPDAQ